METAGSKPAPWHQLKLTLRWIVFEDQRGNFVLVDPQRPRPLGLSQTESRPPTIYVAATDAELSTAMEEMLHHYEHATSVNSRHVNLVERVQEARGRHRGIRKAA
jgi:hypothetical protein